MSSQTSGETRRQSYSAPIDSSISLYKQLVCGDLIKLKIM